MALTKHQLLHINQVIKDANEEKNIKAVEEAYKILASGIFPKEKPYQVHDYLEKSMDGIKWQTP